MALKDWRRLDEYSWIKNAHRGNQKYLYYNNEGYVVIASSRLAAWKDKGKTLKKCKSKLQALKYARSYMRKH